MEAPFCALSTYLHSWYQSTAYQRDTYEGQDMLAQLPILRRMPNQKEPTTVFGARLLAARRARGMTQTQLADAIGNTQKVISYYEATGGNPSAEIIMKLTKTLGVTADDLLGLSNTTDAPGPESTDERRVWRRFRQLMQLPEKDRRAVLRMLDSLTKAQPANAKQG
jgi:transcriptional regulator with XRE-family HTH domain